MRRTHARRTSVPILCFVPAVGLVLGIVALAQIRKRGERGKGLAVGGMVMSSLGLALLVLAVATGGVSDFWDGFKGGMNDSARTGTVFSLRKGDCFDEPGDSSKSVAVHVDKVPCAGRHHAEVIANFAMSGAGYPGRGSLLDVADAKCRAFERAYAMDAWAVPDDIRLYHFILTRDSWNLGRHSIICMLESGDGKSGLTGSLRKDGFTLNADQFAYLQAVDTLDEALRAAPAAQYVDDDLRGYKEWATSVSVALDDEAHLLRVGGWFPAAEKPVATLVDDIEASRKEWTKAAAATDADTFSAHYKKGLKLIDPRRTVTARKVLGLTTTPPSSDGGGGSRGHGGSGGGLEV
ncbi:DUF4190 domain-containing protein [Streptomyces mirabilis]|uniref:DUF4190 domain-containing protein n=1 Tax=Streptomyces mirabilis TaxID=68239 RepID=UPI00167CD775|nr:DUF4190 domain-containing protein [Streptomyces mirabilis]